jgi:DNA adenine methylase
MGRSFIPKRSQGKVSSSLKPPITYYGGKQRLSKELLRLIPQHKLYVEAFMGGGALFFRKSPSESEIINDINGEVVNFYFVLQSDFYKLQKRIKGTLHSRSLYEEASRIYNDPERYDKVTRAWAFWVVTNQGFSSRIGAWGLGTDNKMGKSLNGKRERFTEELGERLKHVQIESRDAIEVIRRFDSEETFFYLDPPYFNSNCGHYRGFLESDFLKLLEVLSHIKGKFLLSSYPSEVLDTYIEKHKWKKREKEQGFCVSHSSKKKKTELMVFNYEEPEENSFSTQGHNTRLHDLSGKSKLVVEENLAQITINNGRNSLQRDEELLCFGETNSYYDLMLATPENPKGKFSDQAKATMERIYRSLSNGIRSAKAHVPRQWLKDKKLSAELTGACFNSGQIHHRKSEEFKAELARVGFARKSNAGTNGGTPYTVFGIFSVMFPLRNEKNEVVNFYAVGIRNDKKGFMNDEGIYPQYPHEMTKKLYIVQAVMDAAILLESRVMDNREAVIALQDGEYLPQHAEAISRLKHLEEIVIIESPTANNPKEKNGKLDKAVA